MSAHDLVAARIARHVCGLRNLYTLYLGSNQLTSIESRTFQGLNKLEKLTLDRNQLTTIESGRGVKKRSRTQAVRSKYSADTRVLAQRELPRQAIAPDAPSDLAIWAKCSGVFRPDRPLHLAESSSCRRLMQPPARSRLRNPLRTRSPDARLKSRMYHCDCAGDRFWRTWRSDFGVSDRASDAWCFKRLMSVRVRAFWHASRTVANPPEV